jgi:replicative DNA helicase
MKKDAYNPVIAQNLERAEALLLGSLLLHPEGVTTVRTMLQPADFSWEYHRLIYESLLAVTDTSERDLVQGISILLTQDELERIGGVPYLSRLKQQAEDMRISVEEQANHLKQTILNSLLRQVRETLHDSTAQSNRETLKHATDDLDRAISIIQQLPSLKFELSLSPPSFQADLNDYVSDLETRRRAHGVLIGIPTGFADLDMLTGGLQGADLIVVAGPPSSGKTGFALSIALHVLLQAHRSVGLFSLEAPRRQVIGRLLSMQANLDQRLIRSLEMEDEDWTNLKKASVNLSESRLWIDDSASLSTTQLHDKAHILVQHYGVELLIVDYVHLMFSSAQDRRQEDRVQEAAGIGRDLKVLARELNIPILASAQVSRAFGNGPTKELQLSELRGEPLENDADLVLFLSVDEQKTSGMAACQLATIGVVKHRNGPRTELDVCFYPGSTRFRDLRALPQPLSKKQTPSSIPPPSAQPSRQFPRLRDILEQSKLRRAKDDEPKVVLKPPSSRRELPQGYFLEDEEAEREGESDRTMTTFGDEQKQSSERT